MTRLSKKQFNDLRRQYGVPKNARWMSVNGQYFSRNGRPPRNVLGGYSIPGRVTTTTTFPGNVTTVGGGLYNQGFCGCNFNSGLGGSVTTIPGSVTSIGGGFAASNSFSVGGGGFASANSFSVGGGGFASANAFSVGGGFASANASAGGSVIIS